ncbi:carbonic anhydrase [Bacteroidota bacterium]
MKSFDQMLLTNRSWVLEMKNIDPDYFAKLSVGQSPKYLWIGCSDSRIPIEIITGSEPGEIFVHRNIANLVRDTDPNLMSVVKYAVDYLKVKHIVICGHYNCGGVKAAYDDLNVDYIGEWISDIKNSLKDNIDEIEQIQNETDRVNRLAELSVLKQVDKLRENSIIQNAWDRKQRLFIHGWIFDIFSGELKVLKEINPDELKQFGG